MLYTLFPAHSGGCGDAGREYKEYTASTKQLVHIAEQESAYNDPDFNIDWDEVKLGKAAGMPGAWKTDEVRILCSM